MTQGLGHVVASLSNFTHKLPSAETRPASWATFIH